MSEQWRADPPPASITGRPRVGWTTHLREATRVLRRLVALGGIDDLQAQHCEQLLTTAVPDPERWVLFSVDLQAPRDASLAELSFWISRLQELASAEENEESSSEAHLDSSNETHLRSWLNGLSAAVREVWPEIALSQAQSTRRQLLEELLIPHGGDQERAFRRERFLAVIDSVAAEIGGNIRRPEDCAATIAAGLLELSPAFVREVFFSDPLCREAPLTDFRSPE